MSITIYHNPQCSKSRQTLELLQEKGIDPVIVDYLKNPLNSDQLSTIISQLGISARQLLRTKEAEYKAQFLDNDSLTDPQIIEAIANTPKLMERPIVVNGQKAAIGRPPENVLEIL